MIQLDSYIDDHHPDDPYPTEIDDPITVVTMEYMGQQCTWDNIKGALDEIESWWDEGEAEEFTIRFHIMSQAAFKALPEVMGW